MLNEFYRVAFRREIYSEVEELQKDLDEWVNGLRVIINVPIRAKDGRTPMETFIDCLRLVKEKNLDNNFEGYQTLVKWSGEYCTLRNILP